MSKELNGFGRTFFLSIALTFKRIECLYVTRSYAKHRFVALFFPDNISALLIDNSSLAMC